MQVHLTESMLAALRGTAEIPDNLLARVNGAARDGAGFVLALSEDEAMAMTEPEAGPAGADGHGAPGSLRVAPSLITSAASNNSRSR